MDLVVTAVVAGVLGTLAMDLLNLLCARTGIISKIEVEMIGRMAVGWARGRFHYAHPTEMQQVANEKLYGYVTHYAIGVGLAVPYVFGWALMVGRPISPAWALTMVSVRRWPRTSSFTLPWVWGCLACGLPKA